MRSLIMTTTVIAVCDMPEGVSSMPGVGPIDFRRLFENAATNMLLHADICDNYLCIPKLSSEENWARFIAVARNCHEQNVELTNTSQGLILRTIRPIKAYEELFVWIGSDLLSKLEFPFLKPSNIRGNKAYHCHKCGSVFEDPNPLKVHLSFLCQRFDIPTLRAVPDTETWTDNIQYFFPLDATHPKFPSIVYNEKTQVPVAHDKIEISLTRHEIQMPVIHDKNMCFSEKKSLLEPFFQRKDLKSMNLEGSFRTSINNDNTENDLIMQHPILHQPVSSLTAAASSKWELDVNCSRISQGHMCTFCGKIYSRKYGLKIHVRTHTGYKPLKCKYCLRPFSDPSNLNKHIRLHSDADAPYRCTKCGKILVRRRDLERHMKSRHPEISNQ